MVDELDVPLPHNGWVPRDDQVPLWDYLENGGTRAVDVCHRRWGKDEVSLHFTAVASQQRIGNYWHMLPQFNQCRKAIWEAINPRTGKKRVDEVFPVEMRTSTRNTDMYLSFLNGSSWQLVGSDNYNSLVGSPPIGIVFSEYALSDPQCWAYLSPILEENGGWAIFISTSRGNNHLKRIYDYGRIRPAWFAELLPASRTPVFTPERLVEIRMELIGAFGQELGEAMYEQEYECSFEGAVIGSYYGRQMSLAKKEGRITKVPYETGMEVYTFWDLGVDDSMTIWFMQFVGREVRVIDYYENTGMGLAHYAKILKEKPYVYGDHYMPHDASVREMSSPGETAKTRQETAEDLGIRPIIVVQRPRNKDAVLNGIEMVRNILGSCYFDEVKCQVGISALEGYKSEYDEEKKVMKNTPLHDWCSHGCLAADTLVLTDRGEIPIKDVTIDHQVWTPRGYAKVLDCGPTKVSNHMIEFNLSNGKTLRCTPGHKILTKKGFVKADALGHIHSIFSGGEFACTLISWISMVTSLGYREAVTAKTLGTIPAPAILLAQFGNFIMDLSRKGLKFITRMRIPSMMKFQTMNYCPSPYIKGTIPEQESHEVNLYRPLMSADSKLPNGIDLPKGSHGTNSMVQKHGIIENGIRVFAKNVVNPLCRLILRGSNTAIQIVSQKRCDGAKELVYDLTIENHACYQANGVLVSNSDAFRTFAVGYKPKRVKRVEKRVHVSGWAA